MREGGESSHKDKSQIRFDHKLSKEDEKKSRVSRFVSSIKVGLASLSRSGSEIFKSEKEGLPEGEIPPIPQSWKVSQHHKNTSIKPSQKSNSLKVNDTAELPRKDIPIVRNDTSSKLNAKNMLKPQAIPKASSELLQPHREPHMETEIEAPSRENGFKTKANIHSLRLGHEAPSNEDQLLFDEDKHSRANRKSRLREENLNESRVTMKKKPSLRSPNVVQWFPSDPPVFRKIYVKQPSSLDKSTLHAQSEHDEYRAINSQRLFEARTPPRPLATRPKVETLRSVQEHIEPEIQGVSNDRGNGLTKNLYGWNGEENPRVVYQGSNRINGSPVSRKLKLSESDARVTSKGEENARVAYQGLIKKRASPVSRKLKLSEGEARAMSKGEKKSQLKQMPLNQEFSEKRSSQTIETLDLSQTKRDRPPSVNTVTKSEVEAHKVSEKNIGAEYEALTRKSKNSLAGSRILSHSSETWKIDDGATSEKGDILLSLPTKHFSPNGDEVRPNLTLLEELFPEEISKLAALSISDADEEPVPRLPLPEFDDDDESYDDASNLRISDEAWMPAVAAKNVRQEWNLAALVVHRASKSLNENDFRRIIPRGTHIDEWRGPGDFLKGEPTLGYFNLNHNLGFTVIPARDQSTLRQASHYFLLFPNPAYARTYQSHVISLHRIARTHTPTSIESPMLPPPGMLVDGEDVYSILQNYTLSPPSQKISLRVLFPPYRPGLKRLLELRGYPQITKPVDKSCKSVLFWVEGFQPTIRDIKDLITRDSRHRGLDWALADSPNPVEKVDSGAAREWEEAEFGATEPAETSKFRGLYPRYLIQFADEDEARRFVRAWHRRPFPTPNERPTSCEPPPLVHAEFVW